ncbi:MAG: Mrp/NBP35 family ATP-binding protein, partial [Polyangiales bacterium]
QLELAGERVEARIRLHSPSAQLQAQIQASAAAALQPLGIRDVRLHWDVRVPTRDVMSGDPIAEVRNVILVMSGKGGVGKSSVATNLALAFKRAGTRVGLLDADVYGPSIPTMLGITGQPVTRDGKKVAPLERFGIKLMSIGFLLEDPRAAVIWRGPMLTGALNQFLAEVDWGPLDYLVLDLPPGTGDVALTLAQRLKVSGAVMVTTPQEVALQDVYKAISMCAKLNIPVLGVVENMSYFVDSAGVRQALFGAGGGAKAAEFAGAPLLGQVPIDPLLQQWGDRGTPVVQAAPSAPAAQVLTDIAERLATRVAQAHFQRGGGDKAPRERPRPRLQILR